MVKFFKFCSESLHGDTDRRCCVQMQNFIRREIVNYRAMAGSENISVEVQGCRGADGTGGLPIVNRYRVVRDGMRACMRLCVWSLTDPAR